MGHDTFIAENVDRLGKFIQGGGLGDVHEVRMLWLGMWLGLRCHDAGLGG